MGSIIVELWAFMRERKKFWLLPVIVVLAMVGALLVFSGLGARALHLHHLLMSMVAAMGCRT